MCHWGPSPLLTMALSFTDYTMGSPITPGVNYKVVVSKAGAHAYLLTCSVADAVLQLTETQPADNDWSNVETYVANGAIAGRIFPLSNKTYYFRVSGPPSLAYDSTLAIKDLDLQWPADITPKAIPTDGSPITSGFYSLDALSLSVGKFHSFSIVPAKSGNLVGKHETSDQHQFVATIFGVNAQGYPVSHMTSFANTEQSIFNFDTAKAILHLSAPEGAEFNYTCSIASFSSGSEGSLTPSSDANITGAWSFSNITVPTPTAGGHAANKDYVDQKIDELVNPSADITVAGKWHFTSDLTSTKFPSEEIDVVNKQYSDSIRFLLENQIYSKVDINGDITISGVKTFSNSPIVPDVPTNSSGAINTVALTKELAKYVPLAGDTTILGIKTFASSPHIPAPTLSMQAVNKTYVDTALDSVPTFDPAVAQTISGAWNFTNGLTRTTKASPVNADLMNKEMTDVVYVPKTGNSNIGGIKTFTDGIILSDEKQLVLGAGTEAVKIHGIGAGMSVIEGGTGAHLDVAVSTTFQEPTVFQDATTFSGGVTMHQPLNVTGAATFSGGMILGDNQLLYLSALANLGGTSDGSVSLNGSPTGKFNTNLTIETSSSITAAKKISANGGLQVAGGDLTADSDALVSGTLSCKGDISLLDSSSTQTHVLRGLYEDPDNSSLILSSSGSVDYLKFTYDSSNNQVKMGLLVDNSSLVLPEKSNVLKFVSMMEAAYTALTPKDPGTVYYIRDMTPPTWAIGDKKIVTSDFPAS